MGANQLSVLLVLLSVSLASGGTLKDSSPVVTQQKATVSQEQPKPLWQTKLKDPETDFITFLSKDRVLVGTMEATWPGWGLEAKQILLLNSLNGDVVWATPRKPDFAQTLLATDPAILLQGSKRIVALSPADGTLMWERDWPGGRSLMMPDGESVVLFSKKKGAVLLTALRVKTGADIWSASVENYPEVKGATLDVKVAGLRPESDPFWRLMPAVPAEVDNFVEG